MSLAARSFSISLVPYTCAKCGMAFAVPESFLRRYNENGQSMRCPNPACGWESFVRTESDLQKAKREADRLRERLRWKESELDRTERRRRAAVGQTTKLKNRVRRGVCPLCNRSFENLRRHMESKHGD